MKIFPGLYEYRQMTALSIHSILTAMRGEFPEQMTYFRHLLELVSMSLEWDSPHLVPVELYKAGRKPKDRMRGRLLRY